MISEVYSLHLLLGVGVLAVLYRWIHRPDWSGGFAVAVGAVALGLANHHLTLALAPLPLLVLLAIRSTNWPELIAGTTVAATVMLWLWARLSEEPPFAELALRIVWIALFAAGMVLLIRRRPTAWRGSLGVVAAMILGLAAYLYLPLAAATDPPLCWNCPRTGPAFFHLTNRSEYWGSLSVSLFRAAGPVLGVETPNWARPARWEAQPTDRRALTRWLIAETLRNVSLPMAALAVVAAAAAPWMLRRDRWWILLLTIAAVTSSWLLLLATGLGSGLAQQHQMRPYLGVPVAALALLATGGAGWVFAQLGGSRFTRLRWLIVAAVVAAPLAVGVASAPESSRRGNRLTERLARHLLDRLPPDSVVMLRSDTAFFSSVAVVDTPLLARDIGFDRDDLVVLSSNRLASTFYLNELRRRFESAIPTTRLNAWRPRRRVLPVALPSVELQAELFASRLDETGEFNVPEISDALTRSVFELNRHSRPLYVEMPVVMMWALPYARPEGLLLRLEAEPLPALDEAAVDRDLSAFDELSERWRRSPGWDADLDLRLSLSQLRLGGVHVYWHRGLSATAERAARQAVAVAPENVRGVLALAHVLGELGRHAERRRVLNDALAINPYSRQLQVEATRRFDAAPNHPPFGGGYGLDLWSGSVESVAKTVRNTKIAVRLSIALDRWAAAERWLRGHRDRAKRLQRIAFEADRDPWRQKVRAILLADKFDSAALMKMARDVGPENLNEGSALLLARKLNHHGERAQRAAIRLLERAWQQDATSYALAVELGEQHASRRKPDWKAVRRAFSTALSLSPRDVPVLGHLSQALKCLGKLDAAMAACERARELAPNMPSVHFYIGEVWFERSRPNKAIASYRNAIQLGESLGVTKWRLCVFHNRLGMVYRTQGKFDEAAREYKEAIKLEGRAAFAHYNLANTYFDQGRFKDAIVQCKLAIGLDRSNAVFHCLLGNTYSAQGRFKAAIVQYKLAIGLDRSNAELHSALGSMLRKKGDLEKAFLALKEAIRLDSNLAGAHSAMGLFWMDKREFDKAIDEFQQAIALGGTDGRPVELAGRHRNLAKAYTAKGDFDSAETMLTAAIKLLKMAAEKRPDSAGPHLKLGVLFEENGEFEQAIVHYRQALERDKGRSWWNLAALYVKLRRFPEALAHYRGGKAVGIDVPKLLLAEAQARAEREAELLAILDGQAPLADTRDYVWAGKLGAEQGRHAASARVMQQGFEEHPEFADRIKKSYRYNASCSAALAGVGNAKDAHELPEKQREDLRRQAVEWLQQDLDGWCRFAERGERARGNALKHLRWTLRDKDLVGIRDADGLSKLPTAERKACIALWEAYRGAITKLEKGR